MLTNKVKKRYWSFWLIVTFCVLSFIIIEEYISAPFAKCINDWNTDYASGQPNQYGLIVAEVTGEHLICLVRSVDRHNGFFAAIAAFVVAWFTFSLRESTNNLWSAANDAAVIAHNTLVAANRAWVKVNFGKSAHVYFYSDVVSVNFSITIKNVGSSPATSLNIYIWPIIDFDDRSNAEFFRLHTDKCEFYRGQNLRFGATLFPGEENNPSDRTRSFTVKPEDIRNGLAYGHKSGQDGFVLRVGCCVNYSFSSDDAFHQTRYLGNLNGRNAGWISFDEIKANATRGTGLRVDDPIGWVDYAD